MQIDKHKLEAAQAKAQLTGTQVAQRAGITHQLYSRVRCRGSCSPVTLGKIADALCVNPAELLDMEE